MWGTLQHSGAARVAGRDGRRCGNVGSATNGIVSRAVSGARNVPREISSIQFVGIATQKGVICSAAGRYGVAVGVCRRSRQQSL